MVSTELKQFSQNNCSGLQAMIISGGVGQNRGVEVISPSGNVSCSLPNLPGAGRRDHTQDKGLICGGYFANGQNYIPVVSNVSRVSYTCLNLTSAGWVYTSHLLTTYLLLNRGRWRHSSWAVDDGIILMGGYGYFPVNTTELVKFDGTSEETFGLKYPETM